MDYMTTEDLNLTEEEVEVLKAHNDSRTISPELLDEFTTGSLSAFRKFIMDHNKTAGVNDKLMVLLRGNSDSIIVYRHNHVFWNLSTSYHKGKVSFSFNHARYSPNWLETLEILRTMGFDYTHGKSERLKKNDAIQLNRRDDGTITGGSIGVLSCTKAKFDKGFVRVLYEIIAQIFDDFFKPSPRTLTDQFRKAVENEFPGEVAVSANKPDRSTNPEKRWQQRLFFHYKNTENGYFAYDLEYSQAFPPQGFVKKYAEEHGDKYLAVNWKSLKGSKDEPGKLTTNEPDILAIKFEKGVPKAIAIIEVKSTRGACDDPSGIPDHLKGMYEYSRNPIFMEKRINDAFEMLEQYKTIEFIDKEIELPDPKTIKVERVLLLTNDTVPDGYSAKEFDGGAVDYYRNEIKYSTIELAEKYKCEIWYTDDIYTAEELTIKKEKIKRNDEFDGTR